MNRLVLIGILILTCFTFSLAQKEKDAMPYKIVNSTLVPTTIIHNIYIDKSNDKWIATANGLYKILPVQNVKTINFSEQDWLLLNQQGGNYPLTVDRVNLRHFKAFDSNVVHKNKDYVTTTFFDKKKSMLWIGTSQTGMYRYHVENQVRLVERLNMKNMNLLSNKMNSILVDSYGREWIGTDGGLLLGGKDKWETLKKGHKIQLIKQLGDDVWIIAKDAIWKIDAQNDWQNTSFSPKYLKGAINALVDTENGIWMASDVLSYYNKTNQQNTIIDFPSQQITCMSLDNEKNIWVGTADQGLFIIHTQTSSSDKTIPSFKGQPISKGQIISLEKVYFEADSVQLSQKSIPALQNLKVFLHNHPTINIEIGGHTNDLPEDDFCIELSTNRAKNVAYYLIDEGISKKRVLFKGYGKSKPIASNATKEGRKRNQRVEIKILAIGM